MLRGDLAGLRLFWETFFSGILFFAQRAWQDLLLFKTQVDIVAPCGAVPKEGKTPRKKNGFLERTFLEEKILK